MKILPPASNSGFESGEVLGTQSSVFSVGSCVDGQYRKALEGLYSMASAGDWQVVFEFLERECKRKGLSERRRLKYTWIIKKCLELFCKPLRQIDWRDTDSFFFWVQDNRQLSDDTKSDYWNMFRIFAEYLNPNIDVRKYRLRVTLKHKLPEDVFNEQEILKIIESAHGIRNKALISLTYHAALRSGEVRNLRVKDLAFDSYGAVIMVPQEGKTGSRRIRIVEPVPLLAQYMQDHLFRDNPHAPLFYRMDKKTPTVLSSTALNKLVKECASRAGIRKRIHTHLLRHSKATELAKKLTTQELMVYGGWRKLETVQVYTHLSGADIEKKILEINNIRPSENSIDNTDILKHVKCSRCAKLNDSSARFCSHCAMALNQLELPFVGKSEDRQFQEFLHEMFMRWKAAKQGAML